MNLLDENFPEDQLPQLKEWRIPCRRIGRDVARLGIKDQEIIPVLHQIGGVTFFTQDEDFFRKEWCHASYCLVWLEVHADDAASYVRRFLSHPQFGTVKKRMGAVSRVHRNGIHFWRRDHAWLQQAEWPK